MSLSAIKTSILNGDFDQDFSLLYTDVNRAQGRFLSALDGFFTNFGDCKEIKLFSAPGRTEVGGNHTDHQHGNVLAGSVNLDTIAVASKEKSRNIRIFSEGYGLIEVNLDNLQSLAEEQGTTISLIKGISTELLKIGFKVGGFNAFVTSNVLKGSGLSSSASFEVLICTILSHFYNEGNIDPITAAKVSQKAENTYFGKPCGLMDQMACSVGGFLAIDFEKSDNPKINKIDFNLADFGHTLCIINTGGNHSDLTDEYASVTAEMRQVANFFGKAYLSQIPEHIFYSNFSEVKNACDNRAVLRAVHFFDETKRAALEASALENKDFPGFLRLVNESGNSSLSFLQNVYSVAHPKNTELLTAIYISKKFLAGRGAVRVHGGGFAGTIQAIVPNEMLSKYKELMQQNFGENSFFALSIRNVGGYCLKK